jgi:formiminoglutamase
MRLSDEYLVPPSFERRARSVDDPRLGDLIIASTAGEDVAAVIVGFPVDEGVRRNGGREGASAGPQAIRRWLYRLTPDARSLSQHSNLLRRTIDAGDIWADADLATLQERLGEVVASILAHGAVPVILGGGHETAFGHFLGYAKGGIDVHIVNVDAHLDVRPLKDGLPHSGSSFRQAIEHESKRCVRYSAVGLNPAAVSHEHLAYAAPHGRFIWRDDVLPDTAQSVFGYGSDVMATFDIDAVYADAAPGVSAPNPDGLDVRTWLAAADLAGGSRSVRSFDVCELNPRFDVDDRSARLAALTVWWFLRGLSLRSQSNIRR